jgi:tetratricopeptide (TPR) repeat protein
MDIPAAIEVCRKAVAADPENPRLNYQLARAYGYSGMHEEAEPYREAALRAGYPQSLFVMGYILVTGWSGTEIDPCYGGELIRRSAAAGRYAGLVGFPYYAVKGTFTGCDDLEVSAAQLEAMLDAATERGPDYYQGLLIDLLRDRVKTQFR